jgi:hypothetical protein
VNVGALEVEGYGGQLLPCALYEVGGERAAVILPGAARATYRLGGSPARPDLHYTRALLAEQGYNVLEVWWDADTCPDPPDPWCRENALAAITAAGEDRVRLLIGRSLGTIGLAALAEKADLASIWIAPLTYLPHVRDALVSWRGPALAVAGDADDGFVAVDGVETVVVPRGDHGLDVGEAAASARALAAALDEIRAWLVRLQAG